MRLEIEHNGKRCTKALIEKREKLILKKEYQELLVKLDIGKCKEE